MLAVVEAGCGGCATRSGAGKVYEVEAVGKNFAWSFRHAGADGRMGTGDDVCEARDLHVPAHSRVELTLKSEDYVYLFSLPGLKLKEMAAPGLVFLLGFATGEQAVSELRGDDLCGVPHARMGGQLLVEPPGEFEIQLRGMERCSGSKK